MTRFIFEEVTKTKSKGYYGVDEKITMDVIAQLEPAGLLKFPLKAIYDNGIINYDKAYVSNKLRNPSLSTLFRESLREWMELQQ